MRPQRRPFSSRRIRAIGWLVALIGTGGTVAPGGVAPPAHQLVGGVAATRIGAVSPAAILHVTLTLNRSASPDAVSRARNDLRGAGVDAAWSAGAPVAGASVSAAAAQRLFAVRLSNYVDTRGVSFHAPDHHPTIPDQLQPAVHGVLGLDDYPRVHTTMAHASIAVAPAAQLAYYNVTGARQAGLDGTGMTISLPEIDGPPRMDDLNKYASDNNLPAFDSVLNIKTDPAWGTPDSTSPAEVTLDLEIAHTVAPKAKLIVYEASPRGGQLLEAATAAVRDNPSTIISESLGGCEALDSPGQAQTQESVAAQLTAGGGTWLVAGGDEGAYGCSAFPGGDPTQLSVNDLASPPDITAVGGTSLLINPGSPTVEAAWSGIAEGRGSGGGLSTLFAAPAWQGAGSGVSNSFSNGQRQLPDVAANGDSFTGWPIVIDGQTVPIGGTSAAAPLWAGVIALTDQALRAKGKPLVANANPALYDFGSRAATINPSPFHDITLGNNLFYPATAGWDYATGWGTPDANALVSAWLNLSPAGAR